jgi:hypothetical protein
MSFSRRNVLKMGTALAAIPLMGDVASGVLGDKIFSTGSPELDQAMGGGLRSGTVLAVVGPRCSGKTAFLLRLAKANGIMDAYPMSAGTSDMLSIMEREDGKHIGSLMLNAAEPSTDTERADMQHHPAARNAFLARWFKRTQEVTRESGGLFAISVCESLAGPAEPTWLDFPDYIITVNQSTGSIYKSV